MYMSFNTSVGKGFSFPIGTLHRAARRLLGALQDGVIGPPVAARLSATIIADFSAQIELVAKHDTDQSGAFGTLNVLTRSQDVALADLVRLASLVRRSASLAFPGRHSLLRSEFQVGVHVPEDLSSVLRRARRLLAACGKYPDELASQGWNAADTAALSAAIDALSGADQNQEIAADVKRGVTAQRTVAAGALYRQCLLVQNAARIAYSSANVADDPTLVAVRARFLLDEFPTRFAAAARSASASEAAGPVAPATAAPAPLPVG